MIQHISHSWDNLISMLDDEFLRLFSDKPRKIKYVERDICKRKYIQERLNRIENEVFV